MPKVDSAHWSQPGMNYPQNAGIRGVIVEAPAMQVKLPNETLLPRVVIRGQAEIVDLRDYIIIGPIGGRADYLTVTFKPKLQIVTGCFCGSIEEFESELEEKQGVDKQEYLWAVAFILQLSQTRGNK